MMSQGVPTYQLKKVSDVAESAALQAAEAHGNGDAEFVFPRTTVCGRFHIKEKIGSGGFGAIYKAFDAQMKQFVAVKVEKRVGKSYLEKEVQFYRKLQSVAAEERGRHCPTVHWQGTDGQFKVAVFDLMGPSLSDLFYKCRRQFSVKTVLMLADQLISRLQFVHESGIVHRDVKPGNFVMGTGDQAARVFIIDFGLSNMWKDPQSGLHIKYNQESAFRGTHRYASINSHFKSEQSRRDDLEALGYVLIYFASGGLPWQNVKVARHKRRKSIGKYKQNVPIEDLTRGLPAEFAKYMTYVRSLQFEERPNYDYLKNLFSSCFQRLGFVNDRVFDWMQPQPVVPSAGAITVVDPPSGNRFVTRKVVEVDVIEISSDKDDAQATQLMKAPASPVAYLSTPNYRARINASTSMAVPSTPASGSDLASSGLFSPSMGSIFARASSPYVAPIAMSRSPAPQTGPEDDVMLQLSSGSDGLRPGNMPPAQVESPLGASTTSIVSNNLFNAGAASNIPQSLSPVHQSSHSPVSPPLPTDTIMVQDEIDIDVQEEEPQNQAEAVLVIEDDDEDDLVPMRNRKRKRDSVPPQANSEVKADDEDLLAPKRRSVRLANKQRSNQQIVEAN